MNPDDELSLLVGRIARAGAAGEMQAQIVYVTFLYGTHADAIKQRPKLTATLNACRDMAVAANLGEVRTAVALQVLTNAKVSADERNRSVHDLWITNFSEDK